MKFRVGDRVMLNGRCGEVRRVFTVLGVNSLVSIRFDDKLQTLLVDPADVHHTDVVSRLAAVAEDPETGAKVG